MSNFSKRKHLVGQILGQEIENLTEKQSIVKILGSKGNNLHEVESPSGENYLMSMPTKFRNVAYIKAGDFVLVESIDEGGKVRAQMVNIIIPNQIPSYVDRGIWPDRFKDANKKQIKDVEKIKSTSDSDSDDEMFRNTNRPNILHRDSSDNDSGEESDESNSAD